MVAPTVFAGLRNVVTTFLYDDPAHPGRQTGAFESVAYTPEDQALLMGLTAYESDLCVCGVPRSVAWHSEMDGHFDSEAFLCHACTARNDGKPVAYPVVFDTRAPGGPDLPPFVLGVTTTSE